MPEINGARAAQMGGMLKASGFAVVGTVIKTPDGRTWCIDAMSDGGWRLYEIDRQREVYEEHDAVEGDTWDAGDLVDYLRAVGARRTTNQDKVVDAGGRPGDVPPGYDRSDWNA